MAINLRYATKTALLLAVRDAYKKSSGVETLRLANKLKSHIDSGDFTIAEIRSAFGFNVAQYSAFIDRLTTKATAMQTVLTAVGE